MPWRVFLNRRRMASLAVIVSAAVATATSGAAWSSAQDAGVVAVTEAAAAAPRALVERSASAFADRFPNVVLKTHEGKNVRFYDDLLKDKIVLINFFYADCSER